MPVNPLIALRGEVPDVGRSFSNVLLNVQKLDALKEGREQAPVRQRLLEAQTQKTEAAVPTDIEQFNVRQKQLVSSVAGAARQIIPDLQAGNTERVRQTLQNRFVDLQSRNLPTRETEEGLALLDTDPNELIRQSQNAITLDERLNVKKTAFQFGSQETLKDEAGNLFLATGRRNPATGQVETAIAPVSGGTAQPIGKLSLVSATGETVTEKLSTREKEAQIDIAKTRSIEFAKKKVQRTSEITKELSTRNREAARSERTLNKALTLAQQASQGLSGASKLQLSRLIPGIDAGDEAALDAALKELALVQLQQFKGPTTDFEFGVTQSIAGAIGQSQQANIARIKSLKRASWFNKREFDQFERHQKSGGDPDSFRFNFGESVKTKKGVFTLQDIQDTAVQRNMTIEETIKRLNQ